MVSRIEISNGSFIADSELEQLRRFISFAKNVVLDSSNEPYSLGVEKISQEYPNIKILTGCLGDVPNNWIWYPGWLIKVDSVGTPVINENVPKIRWHLWLRRPKPERLNLIKELRLTKLLGTGEVVFPHKLKEMETNSTWEGLEKHLTPWDEYKNFILNSLDIEPGLNGALHPGWDYRFDRALELVSETEITDSKKVFFSEKTWKPIRAGQLFLLWGQPGAIRHLRNLGFKVFDQVIDHSYDYETNEELRLKRCVAELKRLVMLTDLDWKNLWAETYKDRLHNQQHLKQDWKKYLDDKIKDN